MLKYIYRDMMSMVKHLPYGLALGLVVVPFLLCEAGRRREPEGDAPSYMLSVAGFGLYLSMMLVITFLSRENGISKGADLKLFSTWGINRRNNALVIENVLLFIPYGLLGCLAFRQLRGLLRCIAFGAVSSLCIETLQLVTGRGFFQIDDILTNTLGAAVGFLLFCLFALFGRRSRR